MSDIQARLKAINAKHTAEYTRLFDALGKAIVVIGLLFVVGIAALSEADRKFGEQDLRNQESSYVAR